MEKCPNCKNSLCVNPYFTQTLNFLDLMIESNLFELESSEEYLLMEFILSEDFIKRHKNQEQYHLKCQGDCRDKSPITLYMELVKKTSLNTAEPYQ